LKPYGIAPKPYLKIGRIVIMERVEGKPIMDMDEEEIRKAAPQFLRALAILDRIGVQKEECHRPHKHFLLSEGGVKLIDFERAHFKKKPSNITQFLSFLSKFFDNAIALAKRYEKERDIEKVISQLK